MFATIRQWVIKTMMKGQTGVVRTLPKNDLIELNTQITAERMMRNGINPEDMKTVGQVENVVNQIDAPKVNVNPGITGVKKADVLDMEGNKIPEGSGIMGGKQVESDAEIAAKYDKQNKESVERLKKKKRDSMPIRLMKNFEKELNETDLMAEGYSKDQANVLIKARKKMTSGEEMNPNESLLRVKEEFADKTGVDVEDFTDIDFEIDVPDFAKGGRVGLKSGAGKAFIEFLKNAGKTMNDKSPVQAYKDYLKSVKDRAQKGDMKTLAPEMGIIAGGGILTNRFLKKKLGKMNEAVEAEVNKAAEAEVENKADGGRIGLKAGMTKRAFLKLMGASVAGVGAAKSGIFSLGKGATKQAAKEVAQQTTSGMPPPYFFKLAEKIKNMGTEVTATTDRTISKSLLSKDGQSEYILEESLTSGDTLIKKVYKEDDMITNIEIMSLKKGEDVVTKNGKPVRTPDEYEEVTETNSRVYKDEFNDPDYEDGINVDEIIKEVDDQAPPIKYASGGLAYMLGE